MTERSAPPIAPAAAAAALSVAEEYGRLGSAIGAQIVAGLGMFAAHRLGVDGPAQVIILGVALWAGLSTILYTWRLARRLEIPAAAVAIGLTLALATGFGIFLAAAAAAQRSRAGLRRQGVQLGWTGLRSGERERLEAAAAGE